MEYNDHEFPQYNTMADMDDVLESCELLSSIPEIEETYSNSFPEMFPIDDGSFVGTTEFPEVYLGDYWMDYRAGSGLQNDTEDTLRLSYETPQNSSSSETSHCCCCNELSDLKRWRLSHLARFYTNTIRGIADILAELKVLRLALEHFSQDVSLVTEKLIKDGEKDGEDNKDEEAGQVA